MGSSGAIVCARTAMGISGAIVSIALLGGGAPAPHGCDRRGLSQRSAVYSKGRMASAGRRAAAGLPAEHSFQPMIVRTSAAPRTDDLLLARLVWLVAASLAIGLFALSVPAAFIRLADPADPLRLDLHPDIDPTTYAIVMLTVTGTAALTFFGIGLVIAHRRFSDRVALVCSALVLAGGGTLFSLDLTRIHPVLGALGQFRDYLVLVLIALFLGVFPDGRWVPRRFRWLAFVAGALGLAAFTGDSPLNWWLWPGLLPAIPSLTLLVVLLGGQMFRYLRSSTTQQRQQQKWVMAGFSVWLLVTLLMPILPHILPQVPARGSAADLVMQSVLNGAAVIAPVSLAIAVLRHRLWDIDILINRTLVYGLLTGMVVGAYVLVVTALGLVLSPGQPVSTTSSVDLAVSLVATGFIAAAFQPVRMRVQSAINRLLYGDRDDPYSVVVRLGQRLDNTLAAESVLPTIVHAVVEALRLPYAAIRLRGRDGEDLEVAAVGEPPSESVSLPLVYQAEQVGTLLLAPRAPGEGFSGSDRELLEMLARQAGAAVHAVRLHAELQRARERLVAAREEERRRLRRDLHDGLGSQLVGLSLQLGGLRTLIGREPAAAVAHVADLQVEFRGAVTLVRQLVHDLRPPALDELGLVAALRQLVERQDVRAGTPGGDGEATPSLVGLASPGVVGDAAVGPRIWLDASDELPPLSAAIEVALYRITQEALANTLKHARARGCHVSLRVVDRHVELAIADDGVGMPAVWTPGVGLGSMRERAEELGGELNITSGPRDGTRVCVRLPLRDVT
jgi:signal transduction histidine kinase